MNRQANLVLQAAFSIWVALAASQHLAQPAPAEYPNAIDKYVEAPDEHFDWNVAETLSHDGFEVVAIDLTSQQWLTEAEVDRPIWKHRLLLTVPHQLHASGIGFLYISGGSNRGEPRTAASALVNQIALSTGMVVAELHQVPNQPLVFHDDGVPRYEDDLIAYAWAHYLKHGDPKWLPRNAMVKSAVRAMDVMTAFMASHRDGQFPLDKFAVGGGSKRGWTTWMTGAMDKRVVAIVPIVIDVLNVEESMRHHFAAYGFWAPSIYDYVRHGITQQMATDELKQLYELVDPFAYVHRLHMPKFVVNASGDQFFLPDSSQFYWESLPANKYLRYVPNADHGLGESDAGESVAAFLFALTRGVELPSLAWNYIDDRQIDVTFNTVPTSLTLWQATNLERRDFRLETFGPGYSATSYDVDSIEAGATMRYAVPTPAQGWTAWFMDASFDIGFARPLKLTTEVRVTPASLPFTGKEMDQPLSLTFVIKDREMSEQFEVKVRTLLREASLGTNASFTTQANRIYVHFTPLGEPSRIFGAFVQFLAKEFGADTALELQLESGPSATIAPALR